MAKALPLFQKARVRLSDERTEVTEHVPELVGFRGLRNRLIERLVELREIPQEDPLASFQAVTLHVVRKAGERLEHLASDRLRAHVRARGPWMRGAELVEGAVQKVRERFGMGHLFEARHSLLVRNSLRFELRDELALRPVHLPSQDHVRVLQARLAGGEGVHGVRTVSYTHL